MKLAMAQMRMTDSMEENLGTSLEMCALARGSDLLFFPEIQLTPFFPQYEKRDVSKYALTPDSDMIARLKAAARDNGYYMSPNVYLELDGKRYDTSLWIDPQGEVLDSAEMVHIAQAEQFYEQDYYTPAPDGFKVFDTPFGKVGIVICFDRHLPESIRTCTMMGAELIIIPTANTEAEPWRCSSGRCACRQCRIRCSLQCATAWGLREIWTLQDSRSSCIRAVMS